MENANLRLNRHRFLPPLPIRIYRLHAKLMLAAAIGLIVAAAMLASTSAP